MTDKASKRLQLVLKLAELKQQRAARELGEASRQVQAAELQSSQLDDYQSEYNQQFGALNGGVINASKLRNYQRFYGNLSAAVAGQQQQLALLKLDLESARNQWQSDFARQQRMADLIARKEAEESKEEENRLQKELDDRYTGVAKTRALQFSFEN